MAETLHSQFGYIFLKQKQYSKQSWFCCKICYVNKILKNLFLLLRSVLSYSLMLFIKNNWCYKTQVRYFSIIWFKTLHVDSMRSGKICFFRNQTNQCYLYKYTILAVYLFSTIKRLVLKKHLQTLLWLLKCHLPHFCKFCCLFFLELREISRARFTVWHTPLIPMDFRYWASCSKEIKPQSGLNLDDHTDNYRTKFHQLCPRK